MVQRIISGDVDPHDPHALKRTGPTTSLPLPIVTHVTRAIISGRHQTTAISNVAPAAEDAHARTSATIWALLMFRNGSKDRGEPRQLRCTVNYTERLWKIAEYGCARVFLGNSKCLSNIKQHIFNILTDPFDQLSLKIC